MIISNTPTPDFENLDLDLPVLPHTLLLAMGLSRQADHVSIDEVIEAIEKDPGAVARVLRVVNSALYGLRREVTSLHRAVVGLGPQTVLGIVISVSLSDMKQHLRITKSDAFTRLIRHSVAVGYIARQMVSLSNLASEHPSEADGFESEAFTLGLLHDFGKLVLFHNYPEKAVAFYEKAWEVDTDAHLILQQEKETFGLDHAEAGCYLMRELNFLRSIEIAVASHHHYDVSTEREPGEQYLLDIVVAGNLLANTLGFGFNRSISVKAFMEDPFWDMLFEQDFFKETDKTNLLKKLLGLKQMVTAYLNEIV